MKKSILLNDIFYLNDHGVYEFSNIESIKILFEPTKRVCLAKRLNNTQVEKTQ